MVFRSTVRILVGAALLALSVGCAATPAKKPGAPSVRGSVERLQALQPSDVAVAPINDQTEQQRVPSEVFRRAFVETLIERRYSPLATHYVDANWIDASFKGTPLPDVVMTVTITAWDPSHLYSNGKVRAAAIVALFEGGDATGEVLWQVSLDREVDLSEGRGRPPAGDDLIPKAIRKFAQDALEGLPLRDPLAAHAATPQ
jgi:hypothetical protein